MTAKMGEIARECSRLSEMCLYTSTTVFVWLRILRWVDSGVFVLPFFFGSFASWSVITSSVRPEMQGMAALSAFLAGVLPVLGLAMRLDARINVYTSQAAEFKNLRDRFRQLSLLGVGRPLADVEVEFSGLMDRLERARAHCVTPPEVCFWVARWKINRGDYRCEADVPDNG